MMIMHIFYIVFLLPTCILSRQQEISLNEETPIGTVVFDLNTLSSAAITYQLLESSSLLTFNSTTNLILISKRLDRDTLCPNDNNCSKCQITIKFYDMFHYDILLLIFNINDINDNPPIFSSNSYSISLTENNIPGIKIRLSKAEDIDCTMNGVQLYELTYVIHGHVIISSINLIYKQNQTINQPFYLFYDLNTDDLYLIINETLDRELQNEYIFTITANDYSHTVSTKLILTVLDVNDHIARFSQSIYSINISHSTPIDTVLLKLNAYDPDLEQNARIFYSILTIDGSSNKNDLFNINSNTGELRLVSNITHLDSKRIFKLIIGASDGTTNSIPALATVYVNIIQQSIISITFGSNRVSNNNSQVFIDENLPNATFIAYITSEETLELSSNNDYDRGFFIQKLSDNSLTLLTDRVYDREIHSSYNVFVRSGNNEKYFQIFVNDINDCKPTWNTSLLNINVNNDYMILTLNATDNDANDNGLVSYRKTDLQWPKWIDLIDNRLFINCTNDTDNTCLTDLYNEEIFIDIEAYDNGQPQLSSILKIRLYRESNRLTFIKYELIILSLAFIFGIIFVLLMIFLCIYCRSKTSQTPKTIIDDNCTKEKIIATSSSEQSSSAGSLYGSDNITLETAASCHLDMFLFSPKRTNLLTESVPYQYTFVNKSINSTDNLTNKLFNSIQNDLSLLTETNQNRISNRGTYV